MIPLRPKQSNMKKILLSFSALFVAAMIMAGCGAKNSPKDVAQTWLTGFYHMDYEAAKKVSTEDTKQMLTQLGTLTGMMPDSAKKEVAKAVINITDVKETGDSATVTYTITGMKEQSKESLPPLKLVKKEGKWLVQWSKNDMMGGGTGGADNSATPPPADAAAAPPASGGGADTTKH